jgi:cellulose synthase/poly-beta-1,6-N-acetylglucosamine synthase-like glycosyltransferase
VRALEEDPYRPTVTVLIACHNEAAVVDGLVTSLLSLEYPDELLQLVVVDDRSTDGTGERLAAHSAASPRLTVVHRADGAGGKSAALNAGLRHATGEIVVVFDADHTPLPDVVRRLVRHFRDPAVAAVQGRCRIRNPDGPVSALVALDYLGGYLVNEYGRQSLFRMPAYGGANCAVRACDLLALGGWDESTVTEDTELTLRLVLAGRRVRYDVTAIDEEEGVTTLRRYWRQRYRWARGHQQVWRDHRSAVLRTRRLSLGQRVETVMFLLAFHVPAISVLALGAIVAGAAGHVDLTLPWQLPLLGALLFMGPLVEAAAGLLLSQARPREAVRLIWFLPLLVLNGVLCCKALLDGLRGRPYDWAKTARAADASPPTRPASSRPGLAT